MQTAPRIKSLEMPFQNRHKQYVSTAQDILTNVTERISLLFQSVLQCFTRSQHIHISQQTHKSSQRPDESFRTFMDCRTLSSMGRPWQSQPGTKRTFFPSRIWYLKECVSTGKKGRSSRSVAIPLSRHQAFDVCQRWSGRRVEMFCRPRTRAFCATSSILQILSLDASHSFCTLDSISTKDTYFSSAYGDCLIF